MFSTSPTVSLSILLSVSSPAAAQPTTPVTADDQPSTATSENEGDDVNLIVVTGRAQKLYRVDASVSGKLPVEPLLSSQSITVLTEQLIDDQGARSAKDLYRNISGVSAFSYSNVTARGFKQKEIFYDGLRGDPYVDFSVPQLFSIERVEFLKGPAGMLYGPGAPGGLFNYITKKPGSKFAAEVNLLGGNENRYGGSAEVNVPLGRDFSARAGLFYEHQGLFRDHARSRTLIADSGFSYDAGPAQITVQLTHFDQELDGNRLRGVPVDEHGNFIASRRWNHNEPGDYLNLKSDFVQTRIEAQPLDNLSLNATIRYIDGFEEQQYHEPRGLFDADGDGIVDSSKREFRDQKRYTQSWSIGGNAIWATTIGNHDNRLLFGFDHYSADYNLDYRRSLRGGTHDIAGRPNPISLVNRQYGLSDSSTYDMNQLAPRMSHKVQQGVYLLDELTFGKFILTGGLRFDRADDDDGSNKLRDQKVTYRSGLVYRIADEVSLYGQYATSFQPQNSEDQDPLAGGPFVPTVGDIFEAGVKTDLMNGRIQSTLAAYRIRRSNLLQAHPLGDVADDGVDDKIALGEVISKGIEFDIAADITPDWVMTLAYGYNDTKVTSIGDGSNSSAAKVDRAIGGRFANAPKHQLGLWTRYQIPELHLAFAIGSDYVSRRINYEGQTIKPYVTFDTSIIYEQGPYRALLRIDNLFDKHYAESGFRDRTGHFPGEPRSVFLEIGYRFK